MVTATIGYCSLCHPARSPRLKVMDVLLAVHPECQSKTLLEQGEQLRDGMLAEREKLLRAINEGIEKVRAARAKVVRVVAWFVTGYGWGLIGGLLFHNLGGM